MIPKADNFSFAFQNATKLNMLSIKTICLYNFDSIKAHFYIVKKVREKSRECHNHKPQPFPDPKRKRKPTNPNKHEPNKRTKSPPPSPSEAIATPKGPKNTRTKRHMERHTTNRLVELVLTSTHNLCFEQKYKNYQSLFILKIFSFWR